MAEDNVPEQMSYQSITIKLGPRVRSTKILVDGKDVSNSFTRLEIVADPRESALVQVHLTGILGKSEPTALCFEYKGYLIPSGTPIGGAEER